jgi:hypothetical protein
VETVAVLKLKGKSKDRIGWKPQADVKIELFLIERLGIAAVSERSTRAVIPKLFVAENMDR